MSSRQPNLMSNNQINYDPLSDTEKDSNNPPSTSRPLLSAETVSRKYAMLFGLHFVLTALVVVFLCCLDEATFNTNSYKPKYIESDGSISRSPFSLFRQSYVTALVSLAASATNFAGVLWSGGYLWRCVLLATEDGGISLKALLQVVSKIPVKSDNFGRRSNNVIIFITLFVTYAFDIFPTLLNSSVVWEPSFRSIRGKIPVTGIQRGVNGTDMASYSSYPDWQENIVEFGAASANLAWVSIQPNSANITQPSSTFRRVLNSTRYLSINLGEYPDSILTTAQLSLFLDHSQFSPYFAGRGTVGLLPDRTWGPGYQDKLGNPHIVAESRLLTYRLQRRISEGPCPRNYSIDPGSHINFHQHMRFTDAYDCFAIANVTYRAGAALCQDCRLISPTVVQVKAPLQIIPDSFTSTALGLTPSLSTYLIFSGFAVPQNYGTNKNLVIELTSRAYQAAWGAFSDILGSQKDDTAVDIAIPVSRAKVTRLQVYSWAGLHFGTIVLGILFVYVRSRCGHPWVDDPATAVLWLDTSAISGALGQDPWKPEVKLPVNDGMLKLEKADEDQPSRYRVVIHPRSEV